MAATCGRNVVSCRRGRARGGVRGYRHDAGRSGKRCRGDSARRGVGGVEYCARSGRGGNFYTWVALAALDTRDDVTDGQTGVRGDLARVDLSHVDVGMFVDHCDRTLGGASALLGRARRIRIEHALQAKTEERLSGIDRSPQRLGVGLGKFTRILTLRKLRDADADFVLGFPFVEPFGRALTRSVGVECKYNLVCKTLENAYVLLGEGGTACRHRTWNAGAVEADHVGVPLADDHLVGTHDVGFGPVQPVERSRLGINRCFG